MKWLLNPTVCFEPTLSIPDTFQVQIITEIYDEIRVNRRIKAEFRFLLIDFVPFLNFCIGVDHVAVTVKKRRDCVRVLNLFFLVD